MKILIKDDKIEAGLLDYFQTKVRNEQLVLQVQEQLSFLTQIAAQVGIQHGVIEARVLAHQICLKVADDRRALEHVALVAGLDNVGNTSSMDLAKSLAGLIEEAGKAIEKSIPIVDLPDALADQIRKSQEASQKISNSITDVMGPVPGTLTVSVPERYTELDEIEKKAE